VPPSLCHFLIAVALVGGSAIADPSNGTPIEPGPDSELAGLQFVQSTTVPWRFKLGSLRDGKLVWTVPASERVGIGDERLLGVGDRFPVGGNYYIITKIEPKSPVQSPAGVLVDPSEIRVRQETTGIELVWTIRAINKVIEEWAWFKKSDTEARFQVRLGGIFQISKSFGKTYQLLEIKSDHLVVRLQSPPQLFRIRKVEPQPVSSPQ
jgi:hypothetical protein